jgi:hypothetical protein
MPALLGRALLQAGLLGPIPSGAQFGPTPDGPVVVARVAARPVKDEVTFIGTGAFARAWNGRLPNGRLPAGGTGSGG